MDAHRPSPGISGGLVAIVVAWLASLLLWLSPGVTLPDGIGYFEYLPSAVHDGDLSFFDQWERAGLVEPGGRILHEQVSPTGLLGNHWPSGSATFWLPAFLAGDVVSRLQDARPASGAGMAQLLPPILASALAGLVALALSWSLARRLPGERAAVSAAMAAIAIWFGSPLLFYSIRNALTSHAVGAMACALCVLLAVRLRERLDGERALAFGLSAGFAFAVRPQNAPFAMVPLFMLAAWPRRARMRVVPHAVVGCIVGALPQLVVSTFLYGSPFGFLRPSGGAGQAFSPFERIWIWEPLLSWYHGMLPWTPLLGLAILGLGFLWRADPGLGRAGIFCFASQWAINASLERSFWGGYAFGQRRFDNCTVFFVLGLAALIGLAAKWRPAVAVLVVASCAWTTALVLAAPLFDLNAYQPVGVVVDAQLAALRDAGTWLRPLASVPEGFRWQVLASIAAMLALAGLAGWSMRRASHRVLVVAASAWLVGASLLFLRAGLASGDAGARRAELVAFNRSLGIHAGAVDFRLGLLREELKWLEATGRDDAAARTRADIADIERQRREDPRP